MTRSLTRRATDVSSSIAPVIARVGGDYLNRGIIAGLAIALAFGTMAAAPAAAEGVICGPQDVQCCLDHEEEQEVRCIACVSDGFFWNTETNLCSPNP